MNFTVTPFEPRYLDQLELLPPDEWQTNAYNLFMHNEWQPWFHPYQVLDGKKLVGFGMLFHFEKVVWLGWILVHKNCRNQGIGTGISKHLIEEGTRLGATTFLLTATDLGAPIYKKLGFNTTSHYRFFKVPEQLKTSYDKTKIRRAALSDFDFISKLDQQATGEKRGKLLLNHLDETAVYIHNEIKGFYIPNLGNGFLVASSPEAGIDLLNYRLKKNKQLIAVPDGNNVFIDHLISLGFNEGFKIPRMVLGDETNWKPEMIYCRAAGYCG